MLFSFAVRYSSNPLSKKCHFGHVGGADHNLTFVLQKTAPVTTDKSKERKEKISKVSMMTLREIITDGVFETDSRTPLQKPVFLFGDDIDEDGGALHDGDYKWLRQIGDRKFFLPKWRGRIPYPISSICLFTVQWNGILPDLSPLSLSAYSVPKEHTLAVMGKRSLVFFPDWSDLSIQEGKPLGSALPSSISS